MSTALVRMAARPVKLILALLLAFALCEGFADAVIVPMIDAPVSGYVTFPKDAEPAALPILVGYTGYGVVPRTPTLRNNYIVLSVNAHSIENDRAAAYYTPLARGELISYGFNYKENLDRDKVYFKNMILRDVQAVRYLKTLPEWDGENISLNGGSQLPRLTPTSAICTPRIRGCAI